MIETVKLTVRLSNFYEMPMPNKIASVALLAYIMFFFDLRFSDVPVFTSTKQCIWFYDRFYKFSCVDVFILDGPMLRIV